MNAVLEPGDHVIVHQPCYQSLFEVARAAGCQRVPLAGAGGERMGAGYG